VQLFVKSENKVSPSILFLNQYFYCHQNTLYASDFQKFIQPIDSLIRWIEKLLLLLVKKIQTALFMKKKS
jgi:hypothetical protein